LIYAHVLLTTAIKLLSLPPQGSAASHCASIADGELACSEIGAIRRARGDWAADLGDSLRHTQLAQFAIRLIGRHANKTSHLGGRHGLPRPKANHTRRTERRPGFPGPKGNRTSDQCGRHGLSSFSRKIRIFRKKSREIIQSLGF